MVFFFFFQAEDGIRDDLVTGVQTCALPIYCENDIVDFGVVHYSDAFLAEYLNFTHINRTYQVECDIGYLYAGEQNISCESQSNILDDPQWAVNISTCGEPLFSCSQ